MRCARNGEQGPLRRMVNACVDSWVAPVAGASFITTGIRINGAGAMRMRGANSLESTKDIAHARGLFDARMTRKKAPRPNDIEFKTTTGIASADVVKALRRHCLKHDIRLRGCLRHRRSDPDTMRRTRTQHIHVVTGSPSYSRSSKKPSLDDIPPTPTPDEGNPKRAASDSISDILVVRLRERSLLPEPGPSRP